MAAAKRSPDRSEVFLIERAQTIRGLIPGVARGRRRRLPGGVALLTLCLGSVGWTIVLSAPPARADCPILDPICVVEEAVDPVPDVVEPIVDEVLDEIDEVVEPVIEVIVEVVEDVEDTIAPATPTVPMEQSSATGEVPDHGIPPQGPPAVPSDPADPIGPGEPGSGPDVHGGSTIVDGGGGVSEGDPPSGLPPAQTPATSVATPTVAFEVQRNLTDRLAGTLFKNGTAAVAFPLLLGVIVAAFLLVQGRVDRHDPRFVLAPVRPGVLRFD